MSEINGWKADDEAVTVQIRVRAVGLVMFREGQRTRPGDFCRTMLKSAGLTDNVDRTE